jgi:two-component system, NarL family, sensor histidine kinase BarA
MNLNRPISNHQQAESGNVQNGKSILIVDDNEINQKLLRVYLLPMGFHAFVSKDGYSALNVLEKHPIDLVFLDLHMPVMNGYETTHAIRQLGERYSRIPIIGLSADGLPNSRQKALQSGMDEYLVKPIKQQDLRQILSRWFNVDANTDREEFSPNVISRAEDLRLMLIKEMPDYKLRLTTALEQRDYTEIHEIAHRIAGGSAYCELPELHRISNLLQTSAKRRNDGQIDLYSAGLLEHINHMLRDLPAVAGHG